MITNIYYKNTNQSINDYMASVFGGNYSWITKSNFELYLFEEFETPLEITALRSIYRQL